MSTSSDPRLGQVMTPARVADLVLSLALEGAPARPTVLDPACGDGVFLARAAARGVAPSRIHGIDVDPHAAAAARGNAPGCQIICGDFFAAPRTCVDAIVGNPPYVRQELVGTEAKRRIAACLADDWPDLPPGLLAGRADLALAVIARALAFLRPGGRLGFVVSQAALEASYGSALRRFLAERAALLAVIASPRERWFADAAVHGVILILERRAAGSMVPPARFARLRGPVAAAAERVRGLADLDDVAEVRTLSGEAAWTEPWGPLLRAPEAWFAACRAAGELFVPLGELCDVRRGSTSGANSFFYMTRGEAERRGIESRFLVPILRTPREASAIRVEPNDLATVAFVCDLERADSRPFPGASSHIRSHADLAAAPSLTARPRWWSLPTRPARLFLSKAYDARFVQPLAARSLLADQRFYLALPRSVDVELLAAALNGTLTALALESLGRASLGEGVLEWSVGDMRSLPVLDVRRAVTARRQAAVLRAFAVLAARPIGTVDREVDAADRRALDRALLADAPDLLRLLPAVREALVATVAERRARAGQPQP